jgi:hypothetical protein
MIETLLGTLHLVLFLIAGIEVLMSAKPLWSKVLWLMFLFLFPLIGVIVYFIFGRGK